VEIYVCAIIVITDLHNMICHFVLYVELMEQDMLFTREKECIESVCVSLGAKKSA